MSNPAFHLDRFVEAQEPVIADVYREMRAGRKQSHWMWFVFPQVTGLGRSPMAVRYAIGSLAEARAYLNHPLLGSRLIELTAIVNGISPGRSIEDIFGSPDDLKFHSSMTLFDTARPASVFRDALDHYFHGRPDPLTLDKLRTDGNTLPE